MCVGSGDVRGEGGLSQPGDQQGFTPVEFGRNPRHGDGVCVLLRQHTGCVSLQLSAFIDRPHKPQQDFKWLVLRPGFKSEMTPGFEMIAQLHEQQSQRGALAVRNRLLSFSPSSSSSPLTRAMFSLTRWLGSSGHRYHRPMPLM